MLSTKPKVVMLMTALELWLAGCLAASAAPGGGRLPGRMPGGPPVVATLQAAGGNETHRIQAVLFPIPGLCLRPASAHPLPANLFAAPASGSPPAAVCVWMIHLAPPEIATTWQFVSRCALYPRAPSRA